jgi:hypothetical protein
MSSPTQQTSTTSSSVPGGASDGQLVAYGGSQALQLMPLPNQQLLKGDLSKMAVGMVNKVIDSNPGSSFVTADGKQLKETGVKMIRIAMHEHLPYIPLSNVQDEDFQMFGAVKSEQDDMLYNPIEGDFDVRKPVLAVQPVHIGESFNFKLKKREWNIEVPCTGFWPTYKIAEHFNLPKFGAENKFVLMSVTSCYGLHNTISNHVNIVGKKSLMHTSFVIVKVPTTHEEMMEASKYVTSKVFNSSHIKELMCPEILKQSEFQSEHLEMLNELYEQVRCKERSAARMLTDGELGQADAGAVSAYDSGTQNKSTVKMLSLIQYHGVVFAAHFEGEFNQRAKDIFDSKISCLAFMSLTIGYARNVPEKDGTFLCNLSELYTDQKGHQESFKLERFFEKTCKFREMRAVLNSEGVWDFDPFGDETITLGKDGWVHSPMFNMTKDEKNLTMFWTDKTDPEQVGSKRRPNRDLTPAQIQGLTTTMQATKYFTDQLVKQRAEVLKQRLIQQYKDKEYVSQCILTSVFTMEKCAALPEDFMTGFEEINSTFNEAKMSQLFDDASSIYSVVNVLLHSLLKVDTHLGKYGMLLFEKVKDRVTYTVKAPKTEISRDLVDVTCKWYIAQVICVTAYTLLRLLPIDDCNPDLNCVGLADLNYSDWTSLASELVPDSGDKFKKLMSKFVKDDDFPVFNFTPASVIHIAAYHQLYAECDRDQSAVEAKLSALSAEELFGKAKEYVKTIVMNLQIHKFARSDVLKFDDDTLSKKVTYLEPIQMLSGGSS